MASLKICDTKAMGMPATAATMDIGQDDRVQNHGRYDQSNATRWT